MDDNKDCRSRVMLSPTTRYGKMASNQLAYDVDLYVTFIRRNVSGIHCFSCSNTMNVHVTRNLPLTKTSPMVPNDTTQENTTIFQAELQHSLIIRGHIEYPPLFTSKLRFVLCISHSSTWLNRILYALRS